MSDLGPLSLETQQGEVFLGRDWGNKSEYSEEISSRIDSQVRGIISSCYIKAKAILQENRIILERLVDLLAEQETIDGDLFRKIVEENTQVQVKGQRLAVPH
jgi:cell division protease FtsH